ncbi:hypothetical protein [Candidatus Phytoplasma australasiaticum]|uniref:hypothetical protein n=1 Tax=Candidatus Phytoplasma australasiaticum TaxID=2754999 RepID=UPI00272BDF52|nr:hypothetical protein [Sweet potato little leaf phytoplasma]
MELALSLGDASISNKPFGFLSKPSNKLSSSSSSSLMALGFCVGLAHDSGSGSGSASGSVHDEDGRDLQDEDDDEEEDEKTVLPGSDPPVQLDLLPLAPVPRSSHQPSSHHLRFPWLSDHCKYTPLSFSFLR